MKIQITFCDNVLDATHWHTIETDNVLDGLVSQLGIWPAGAKLYRDQIDPRFDVTPVDEPAIERLATLDGHFFVVLHPGILEGTAAILALIAIAAVVTAFLLRPSAPKPNNVNSTSPNNTLSERENSARPNARIPDIYGQVRSTPDLIAVPYRKFKDNVEVEYAYMCIGRGSHDIADIRDDATLISEIDGSSVAVYGPNTSPNSGTAQLTIGAAISEPVISVVKPSSVNGQLLRAPNAGTAKGEGIFKTSGLTFLVDPTAGIDFTDVFSVGGQVVVSDSDSWNGTYNITAVAATTLTVDHNFGSLSGSYHDATLSAHGDYLVGPFVIGEAVSGVICNFVAQNGLYKIDSSGNQTRTDVTVKVSVQQLTSDLSSTTGAVFDYSLTIPGSAIVTATRAGTLTQALPFTGPCQVWARRTSATDTSFSGQVVDEIVWRDLYGSAAVSQAHFGNVTTIQSVTIATPNALSLKARKLNVLATRRLPAWTGGSTFGALIGAGRAADIISAICLDPYIGGRQVSEVDFPSLYAAQDAVEAYFGVVEAGQFSYTFDDANISFEETLGTIANAIFCTIYRLGSVIKMDLERSTTSSTILFNHRNKIPKSESRSFSFGINKNVDGLTYDWVDPTQSDATVTYYIPTDKSATNPQKITGTGVRNQKQAQLNAWRLWNKLRYQHTSLQFTATSEAALTLINTRISVTDSTRPDTQDGEVVGMSGLVLKLSNPVTYAVGATYAIFLQSPAGVIESIAITPGADAYHVVLATAPSFTPITGYDYFARTTYDISGSSDHRATAFLVTEKTPQSAQTYELKAINYDSRYYQNDLDFHA